MGPRGAKGETGEPGSTNVAELTGAVPACGAAPQTPLCWEGERLRVGSRYFSADGTLSGGPARRSDVRTGMVVPEGAGDGWRRVAGFKPVQGRVLAMTGSAESADGVLVPINVSTVLEVRLVDGALEVRTTRRELVGRALSVAFEACMPDGKGSEAAREVAER
jgi:hypothetical protein